VAKTPRWRGERGLAHGAHAGVGKFSDRTAGEETTSKLMKGQRYKRRMCAVTRGVRVEQCDEEVFRAGKAPVPRYTEP